MIIADPDQTAGEATEKGFNELYGADAVKFVKCDVTNDDDLKGTAVDCFTSHIGEPVGVGNILVQERHWSGLMTITEHAHKPISSIALC